MQRSINGKNHVRRILALDPSHRGVTYAVLEGDDFLVDWGMKWTEPENKRSETLDAVRNLIEAYEPDVIVFEDPKGDGSRRCRRVHRLLESIRHLAEKKGVKVRQLSRNDLRRAFGVYTKEAIASKVAERFPELSDRVPPHRKLWMTEDPRMHLFDAVAFACTYLNLTRRKRRTTRGIKIPAPATRQPRTGLRALVAVFASDRLAARPTWTLPHRPVSRISSAA